MAFAAVTRTLVLAVVGDPDQRPQCRHGVPADKLAISPSPFGRSPRLPLRPF
jgi:hypothetical protein